MSKLKFAVIACGLLGLIATFLPMQTFGDKSVSFWSMKELYGPSHVYMIMAGFAAALVMGILAAAKPPMQRSQAIVSAVGCAFVLFKLRELLSTMLKDGAIGAKLMVVAAIAGLVVSILCVAKPETAR